MRDSPFIGEELDAFLRETPPVWVLTTGNDKADETLLTERYGYEKAAALDYGLRPAERETYTFESDDAFTARKSMPVPISSAAAERADK